MVQLINVRLNWSRSEANKRAKYVKLNGPVRSHQVPRRRQAVGSAAFPKPWIMEYIA